MPATRPLGAATASALLGVIGVAGLLFGPYLVAIGILVIAPDVDSQGSVAVVLEVLLGIGAVVAGIVALAAARGLWRGQGWAWPVGVAIGLILVIATVVVALLDRWMAPYGLLALVGVGLLACLAPRSVRDAYLLGGRDAHA
jgi:hypothetical protein